MSQLPDTNNDEVVCFPGMTCEEAMTVWRCHTVYALEDSSRPNVRLDYKAIADLASKQLNKPDFDTKTLKQFYAFYHAHDAYDLMGCMHHIRFREDRKYQEAVLKGKLDSMKATKPSNDVKDSDTKDKPMSNACVIQSAEKWIELMLPYISADTLRSSLVPEELKRVGLNVNENQACTIVKNLWYMNQNIVGSKLGKTRNRDTMARQLEEMTEARKVAEWHRNGNKTHLKRQMEQVYSDILHVSNFASFQTIASQTGYRWLGAPFRHAGLDPVNGQRNEKLERLAYLRVVCDVLRESEPSDFTRIRQWNTKEYRNFIIRSQEMEELRRRFGDPYNRGWDYNIRRDPKGDLEEMKNLYAIFYGLWNNMKGGSSSMAKGVKSIIKSLTRKNIVEDLKSPETWKSSFIKAFDALNVPSDMKDEIRAYYPSLS